MRHSAAPFLNSVIQTEFDGYQFRSKLEARWALFFRLLSLDYEYEPEGFETLSGRYLPDFKVNGMFIEVKQGFTLGEFAKIFNLSNTEPILTIFGRPDDCRGILLSPEGLAAPLVAMTSLLKPDFGFVFNMYCTDFSTLPQVKRTGEDIISAAALCKSVRFEKGKASLFPKANHLKALPILVSK